MLSENGTIENTYTHRRRFRIKVRFMKVFFNFSTYDIIYWPLHDLNFSELDQSTTGKEKCYFTSKFIRTSSETNPVRAFADYNRESTTTHIEFVSSCL